MQSTSCWCAREFREGGAAARGPAFGYLLESVCIFLRAPISGYPSLSRAPRHLVVVEPRSCMGMGGGGGRGGGGGGGRDGGGGGGVARREVSPEPVGTSTQCGRAGKPCSLTVQHWPPTSDPPAALCSTYQRGSCAQRGRERRRWAGG